MHNSKHPVERRVEDKLYPGPDKRLCPYQGCDKPNEAADKAVKKVFSILGVDVDDAKDVEHFREGLRFGESLHKMANKSMMTIVVVVSAALVTATFIGLAVKLKLFINGGGG